MKTIKLDEQYHFVDELLAMARRETLLLVSPDGTHFLLEEADDFDREVAALGSSRKFMGFLEERLRAPGTTSIQELAKEIHSTKAS